MTIEVSRKVAEQHAADDPTLQTMLARGLPLTRDAYIGVAWGGDVPSDEEWGAEHEAQVPEIFRDPNALQQLKPPTDD